MANPVFFFVLKNCYFWLNFYHSIITLALRTNLRVYRFIPLDRYTYHSYSAKTRWHFILKRTKTNKKLPVLKIQVSAYHNEGYRWNLKKNITFFVIKWVFLYPEKKSCCQLFFPKVRFFRVSSFDGNFIFCLAIFYYVYTAVKFYNRNGVLDYTPNR